MVKDDSRYNKHIGIMGGTFNPIHKGHVYLAEHAYKQYELDKVLVMPTKKPPHKRYSYIVDEYHRENMVRIAIEDRAYLEFSSLELNRRGVTYTYDTLSQLTKEFTDTRFYFILGADSLFQIEDWYGAEHIMKMAVILVSTRHQNELQQVQKRIQYLQDKYEAVIGFIKMPVLPISSEQIRTALEDNKITKDILDAMDQKVLNYIKQNGLYIKGGG